MSTAIAIIKAYLLAVAVGLPATIPQSVNRAVAAKHAGGSLKKEIGLGVLNVFTCGGVEVYRLIHNPMVPENHLEAILNHQAERITGEIKGLLIEMKDIPLAPAATMVTADGAQ